MNYQMIFKHGRFNVRINVKIIILYIHRVKNYNLGSRNTTFLPHNEHQKENNNSKMSIILL